MEMVTKKEHELPKPAWYTVSPVVMGYPKEDSLLWLLPPCHMPLLAQVILQVLEHGVRFVA